MSRAAVVSSHAREEALLGGVRALALVPPTVTQTSPRGTRQHEVSSPFVAAGVCEALCAAADLGLDADADLTGVTRYLRDTQEADGSWCFDPHERRWPPDADSTSCAIAALARTGELPDDAILTRVLRLQPGTDGLIRPWLVWYSEAEARPDGNAADAIVTANVLLAATRLGLDVTGLLGALEDHVGSNRVATMYYDSAATRAYYLARALAPVASEGPTAQALRQYLADVDPKSLGVIDTAAALAAAALLGVESAADRLLPHLLATRADVGGWPEARWFTDVVGNAWSSAAFSTALAVEALVLTYSELPGLD